MAGEHGAHVHVCLGCYEDGDHLMRAASSGDELDVQPACKLAGQPPLLIVVKIMLCGKKDAQRQTGVVETFRNCNQHCGCRTSYSSTRTASMKTSARHGMVVVVEYLHLSPEVGSKEGV